MSNFVTHLECSKAGDCYDHEEINNLSKINKIIKMIKKKYITDI